MMASLTTSDNRNYTDPALTARRTYQMKHALILVLLATSVVPVQFVNQTVLAKETTTAQSLTPELWRQVEIIRTSHGVPHIRAENLRAAGYALAWLQSEDYGPRTAMNV